MPTTDTVTVPASQHYVSRYLPASMAQRVGAIMVDGMLFCALVAVPAWIISWAFGPGGMTGCENLTGSGGVLNDDTCIMTPEALRFTRIVFYALCVVWVLAFSRTSDRGASIGKRCTEIMVVDATTGETISYGRTVARTLLSAVSFCFFGLGLLWALTNRDRRAIHDVVMGTRVISA